MTPPRPTRKRYITTGLITFALSPILAVIPYLILLPFGGPAAGLTITMFAASAAAGYPISVISTLAMSYIASRHFERASGWSKKRTALVAACAGFLIVGTLSAIVGNPLMGIVAIPPAIIIALFYRWLLLRD